MAMSSAWWDSGRYPHFLHKICLLQAFLAVPESKSEPDKSRDDSGGLDGVLSIKDERNLARSLAYLAARSDDPRKVVAVSVQQLDPTSLRVNLAVNHGRLDAVEEGLRKVADILQNVARHTFEDPLADVFREIVRLSQPRILVRLRSKHAIHKSQFKKIKRAQKSQVYVLLEKELRAFTNSIQTSQAAPRSVLKERIECIRTNATALGDIFTQLEQSNLHDGSIDDLLQRLCLHAFRLLQASKSVDSRIASRLTSFRTLQRLGAYYEISRYLYRLAQHCQLFRVVQIQQVCSVCLPVDQTVIANQATIEKAQQIVGRRRNPSQLGITRTMSASEVGQRFGNVPLKSFPVHAEIKLLIYHEVEKRKLSVPRVICSNKLPCLLCHLLFRFHGGHTNPGTHGKLYEKWALPAAIRSLPEREAAHMKGVLDQVVEYVESKLSQLATEPLMSNPHPAESLVGSTLASASTIASTAELSSSSVSTVKRCSEHDDKSSDASEDATVEPVSPDMVRHVPAGQALQAASRYESCSHLADDALADIELPSGTRHELYRNEKLHIWAETDPKNFSPKCSLAAGSEAAPCHARILLFGADSDEPAQPLDHVETVDVARMSPGRETTLRLEPPWHGHVRLGCRGETLRLVFRQA